MNKILYFLNLIGVKHNTYFVKSKNNLVLYESDNTKWYKNRYLLKKASLIKIKEKKYFCSIMDESVFYY